MRFSDSFIVGHARRLRERVLSIVPNVRAQTSRQGYAQAKAGDPVRGAGAAPNGKQGALGSTSRPGLEREMPLPPVAQVPLRSYLTDPLGNRATHLATLERDGALISSYADKMEFGKARAQIRRLHDHARDLYRKDRMTPSEYAAYAGFVQEQAKRLGRLEISHLELKIQKVMAADADVRSKAALKQLGEHTAHPVQHALSQSERLPIGGAFRLDASSGIAADSTDAPFDLLAAPARGRGPYRRGHDGGSDGRFSSSLSVASSDSFQTARSSTESSIDDLHRYATPLSSPHTKSVSLSEALMAGRDDPAHTLADRDAAGAVKRGR